MPSFELQPSSSRRDGAEEVPDKKADISLIESAEHGLTSVESMVARLPKAHRDYLMERHGTLELDPIPGMSPADPYNWPEWKVRQKAPIYKMTSPRRSCNRTKKMIPSDRILIYRRVENDQPCPRGVSRLHGHIYRRRHYPCLF